MKLYFLVFLSFLFTSSLVAQFSFHGSEFPWKKEKKIDKRHYVGSSNEYAYFMEAKNNSGSQIIDKNKEHVYVPKYRLVSYKVKDFSVAKYMDLPRKIDKKILEYFTAKETDKKIWIFNRSLFRKGKRERLYAYSLDKTSGTLSEPRQLIEKDYYSNFRIVQSPDKSKISIFYELEGNRHKVVAAVFDKDLKKIYSKTLDLPVPPKKSRVDYQLDDDANIIIRIYDKIYVFSKEGREKNDYRIPLKSKGLATTRGHIQPVENGLLVVYPYHGKKELLTGLYVGKIDYSSETIENNTYPFPAKWKIGEKGFPLLRNLALLKASYVNNKLTLFWQETTSETLMKANYWEVIYSYKEIVGAQFDSGGELKWQNIIRKNINKAGLFGSAIVAHKNDTYHVLFNDKKENTAHRNKNQPIERVKKLNFSEKKYNLLDVAISPDGKLRETVVRLNPFALLSKGIWGELSNGDFLLQIKSKKTMYMGYAKFK